jgi:hypothetical protein
MPQSRLCKSSASTLLVISSLHITRCGSIAWSSPAASNCRRVMCVRTTP